MVDKLTIRFRSNGYTYTWRGTFKPNSFRVRVALFNLSVMKTLVQIKQAISDQLEYGKSLDKDIEKSKIAKTKKSLQFLRKAETYLMSDPNAEYVKIELDKVKKRIKEEQAKGPLDHKGLPIPRYKPTPEDKKRIIEYDRQMGLNKLRDFHKFLTFLNS